MHATNFPNGSLETIFRKHFWKKCQNKNFKRIAHDIFVCIRKIEASQKSLKTENTKYI